MQIHRILRMETADRIGMYSAGIPVVEQLNEKIRHCLPSEDDLLWFRLGCRYAIYKDESDLDAVHTAAEENISKWWFAYRDKAQCEHWVYRAAWMYELHESGIVVSEYFCKSENLVFGTTQVLFNSYELRFQYDLPTYFNLPPKPSR